MKTRMLPQMIVIALAASLILGTGCATTKAEAPAEAQAQNHEEHHPEGQVAQKDSAGTDMKGGEMMKSGMMRKMDMNQMMDMMNECMAMNKDSIKCDYQTMEKCQEKMGKGECQKMMKQAKMQDEKTKKK